MDLGHGGEAPARVDAPSLEAFAGATRGFPALLAGQWGVLSVLARAEIGGGLQTSHLRFLERHDRQAWFRSRTFFVGGVVATEDGTTEDTEEEDEEEDDRKPLVPGTAARPVVVAMAAMAAAAAAAALGLALALALAGDDVGLSSGRLTGMEEGGEGEGRLGGGATVMDEFRPEWGGDRGLAAMVCSGGDSKGGCVRVCMCMCMCVYVYVYVYMCIRMCVCMWQADYRAEYICVGVGREGGEGDAGGGARVAERIGGGGLLLYGSRDTGGLQQ